MTTFAWPNDPRECPRCHGEGYYYVTNEGRGAQHPVTEVRCQTCRGTGVLAPRSEGP